jgi:hypothetical protein
MGGHVKLRGTVVELCGPGERQMPRGPLYLRSDGGKTAPLMLVSASMEKKASIEFLARDSRRDFAPAIGRHVEVEGDQAGGVLYNARITAPDDLRDTKPALQPGTDH